MSFVDDCRIGRFSEDFHALTLREHCLEEDLSDIRITIVVEYGYHIIIIRMPMRTSEFKLTDILKPFVRKRVISKAELLQDCGCSAMTAWRLLRQVGYCRSYNYNSIYFTLATTPEFDDHGLWAYQDIRFSKWGTLPETMIVVIERSPGGMTAQKRRVVACSVPTIYQNTVLDVQNRGCGASLAPRAWRDSCKLCARKNCWSTT